MTSHEIELLGNAVYRTGIAPYTRKPGFSNRALVVGFNTKFSSKSRIGAKTNELISVQLINDDVELVLPFDMFESGRYGVPVENFFDTIRAEFQRNGIDTRQRDVYLYAFFSNTDLGCLDLYNLESRFRLQPGGTNGYALQHAEFSVLDLSAFFPHQSLEDVARSFGYSVEREHKKTITRRDLHDLFYREFAVRDATLAHKIARDLRIMTRDDIGVDIVTRRTPASVAACSYRLNYLDVHIGSAPAALRYQALRSYWGANNQCYYRGRVHGDVRTYDAISMYPSCAVRLAVLPRARDWTRYTSGDLEAALGGLLHVKFSYPPGEMFPALPVGDGTRLLFPLEGQSHCTLAELRYAVERGADITVLDGFCYADGDNSLARYCAMMLERKALAERDGDRARRSFYKNLLNSLIGKFGQHRVEYDLNELRATARTLSYARLDAMLAIENWIDEARDFGLELEPRVSLGSAFQPEWAALILGQARQIQARAVIFSNAMTGTTDSVTVDTAWCTDLEPLEAFEIDGIQYALESRGNEAVFARTRLYVVAQDGKIVKSALHGCPKVLEAERALLHWHGNEFDTITRKRVSHLRNSLEVGYGLGVSKREKITMNYRWDGKRTIGGVVENFGWTAPLRTVHEL